MYSAQLLGGSFHCGGRQLQDSASRDIVTKRCQLEMKWDGLFRTAMVQWLSTRMTAAAPCRALDRLPNYNSPPSTEQREPKKRNRPWLTESSSRMLLPRTLNCSAFLQHQGAGRSQMMSCVSRESALHSVTLPPPQTLRRRVCGSRLEVSGS